MTYLIYLEEGHLTKKLGYKVGWSFRKSDFRFPLHEESILRRSTIVIDFDTTRTSMFEVIKSRGSPEDLSLHLNRIFGEDSIMVLTHPDPYIRELAELLYSGFLETSS